MKSRERVERTLKFENPDRAPRDLWTLPWVNMFRKEELQDVLRRFPSDFASPKFSYGAAKLAKGTPNVVGKYTDEWGCEWNVAEPGVVGEVKNPPLKEISALDKLKPPLEILGGADFSEVNRSYAETDKFVKVGTTVRPFERMQFLRGTEDLFMDLAYGTAEVYKLREIVHDFFLRELQLWAKTDVDAISFMDDWGAQNSLLISPDLWREYFKPLYADYCRIIHEGGKYVFFHSDGYISEIIPGLIEVGVDALNSQIFCMDIEDLAQKFKGKITFWGEIDRQNILPFRAPEEVKEAVRRVRRALDDGRGGVIAQCEWGVNNPKENIIAVFEAWSE